MDTNLAKFQNEILTEAQVISLDRTRDPEARLEDENFLVFEDVELMPDWFLYRVLGLCEKSQLARAVSVCVEDTQEKIFKNLDVEAAERIQSRG